MKNVMGIIKLGFILTAYAATACVGLAFVYTGTEKVIAERKVADAKAAMSEIFPDADSFVPFDGLVSSSDSVSFIGANYAKSGTAVRGMLVEASGPSYSGKTRVLVGVASDGTIAAVKILENKDTPGLGANAGSPSYYVDKATKTTFYGQFKGKGALDPFEVRKDVAVITASTITSRAVSNIVAAAAKAANATFAASGGKE